eukprot:COSAG02_NODE_18087_length_960_cov_1780.921114_1_plen_43_part_10
MYSQCRLLGFHEVFPVCDVPLEPKLRYRMYPALGMERYRFPPP